MSLLGNKLFRRASEKNPLSHPLLEPWSCVSHGAVATPVGTSRGCCEGCIPWTKAVQSPDTSGPPLSWRPATTARRVSPGYFSITLLALPVFFHSTERAKSVWLKPVECFLWLEPHLLDMGMAFMFGRQL